MAWKSKTILWVVVGMMMPALVACSIDFYKFNGASIDYTKTCLLYTSPSPET